MPFTPGDIVVSHKGAWGHVLMCCKGGRDDQVEFIHATHRKDFAISSYQSTEDNKIVYEPSRNYEQFSPIGLGDAARVRLLEVANLIAAKAKYGYYRAVRLAIGSSEYAREAHLRLAKYRERLEGNGDKLVTTLTCSEAVILCYQLTLPSTAPHFIALDAAHTLPRTLAKYLRSNVLWKTTKVN